jgi:hypothetical protein
MPLSVGYWRFLKGFIMNLRTRFAAVVSAAAAPLSAFAAGPDLTTLTTAVDFGTVTTAILGVSAALIVVYIAWKGASLVIGAVRRG